MISQGVALAASMSGGSPPLSEKKLPATLDVFGWCTWDAFYSKVSAKGICDSIPDAGFSLVWRHASLADWM